MAVASENQMNMSDVYHIEFLRIHRARIGKSWTWSEHVNHECEIVCVLHGRFQGFIDNVPFAANDGEVYFVQPNQLHWEEIASDQLDFITLRFNLYNELGETCGFVNHQVSNYSIEDDGKIVAAMEQMLKLIWRNVEPNSVISPVILKVIKLIQNAVKTTSTVGRKSNLYNPQMRIKPALQLLQENLDRYFSIAELADACYISPNHFSHIFKDVMGISPIKYAQRLRIDKAKRLLADESLCVYEVAEKLGFEDQFYFSRVFKKVTGLSPLDYRNHMKQLHF